MLVREGVLTSRSSAGSGSTNGQRSRRHGLPLGDLQPRRFGLFGADHQRAQARPRQHIGREAPGLRARAGGSRCTQRSRRPTRPALRVPQEGLPGVARALRGVEGGCEEVSPAESIGAVLDESGYKELEAEDTVEAESRLENLEELINASGSTSASSPSRRLKASCRNKPFILIRTL